ncbi:MAG: diacylglycerol kinase family lipid kinase [Chlorobi bacterium]|nr:diacylglycerol kinase family lipid kinase [Chlorobiota bacterium]
MEDIKKEHTRIVFIINPHSGRSSKKDLEENIYSIFPALLYEVSIKYTEYKNHASELSRKALNEKADIIVAVGGDGTINEVASQIIDTECILGIVPAGSGNGLARHLGISRVKSKALKKIRKGKTIKIDTASINNTAFVSIAGLGFDALVADKFSRSKSRGFFSYFKIIAENYPKYRPKKYIIQIDEDTTITTRALFLSFANSNQFGYNTAIAPHAKLNDGKLDLCIVKKPYLIEIPLIANLLLLKKIHLSPFVSIIPVRNIIVKQSKNRVVNIDGEAMKLGKELDIRTNPLSLNVLIP